MVGFGRGEFEFGDETIEFVDDENGSKLVEPGLTKDGDGLRRRGREEEEVSSRFWTRAEKGRGKRVELT